MTRSAVAFLALLILPGMAPAQETQRPATHEVVEGETLWLLAQRYYQNPYLWPRIYEANRGVVEDPHWIYPGESLLIPDVTVTVTVQDVAVVAPGDPAPAVPVQQAEPVGDERTVFWREGDRDRFVATDVRSTSAAVSRDVVYSARWLIPDDTEPPSVGTVGQLVSGEEQRRRTFFTYDLVQVLGDQERSLPVGTALQAYRIASDIDGVGRVAVPTGVITVSQPAVGGNVGLVVEEFERLTPGDLLRPLPSYRLSIGVQAADVRGGPEAQIVGFGEPQAVQGLFDVAFLDRGASAGVAVGDEYVLLHTSQPGWPPTVEGRLQVVQVEPLHASARIVALRNPVFESGVRVVLSRKMP